MYTLIIVDYNSIQNTIEYVSHCKQQLGQLGAGHVVIVENGDRPDTVQLLQQRYGQSDARTVGAEQVLIFQDQWQQICYCQASGNLGYARGNNLGITLAAAIWNDPYYIISNNDLVFDVPLDLHLSTELFTQHPQIGVIGPCVVSPAGQQQSPRYWQSAFRRLIVNVWVGACGAFLPEQAYNKLSAKFCDDTCYDAQTGPCAWVSGCFMLLRAEAMEKAGLFDPNTFLYAEEMILSRRMERTGSEIWFCKELVVIHNHAQTTKKALSVLNMRRFDFEANRYYFKTYTSTSPVLLTLANWNFGVYKAIFTLWQKIKGLRSKEDSAC